MSKIQMQARSIQHYINGQRYHHFKKYIEPSKIRKIDDSIQFEREHGVDLRYWQEENETGRVWSF